MGRPTIAYLNECRKLHREGRMKSKGKWKAPKLAPPEKPRVGERVSRSYSLLLAFRYHKRRQAEIEEAKHLATLDDYEIPF
jgi:hypothetical protein